MAFPITEKQARLKAYLLDYASRNNGRCPTYKEIASGMGIASKSGIHSLIAGLIERGHVETLPGKARAIRIIPTTQQEAEHG